MKRVLLADDSQQALRLGEQILSAYGVQVVSVTDGASALQRMSDVDPDLLIIDVFLPKKNGFELTRFIKAQPEWKRVRVVFAAGVMEEFNEQDAKNAGAEAIVRKPFEASVLWSAVGPLLDAAYKERLETPAAKGVDRSMVRAAVTLALENAFPTIIDSLTDRVLIALKQQFVSEKPVLDGDTMASKTPAGESPIPNDRKEA